MISEQLSRPVPSVSVCIPTYNRPDALASVVDQVLAQTYPKVEIIITDDGDPAPTRRALSRFGNRVRYYANEKRLGIYGNWNRCIGLAEGELVALFHDHDGYEPTFVERCVELFLRSPRVGLVHTGATHTAADGRVHTTIHGELPEIADGRWFAELQAHRWSSYVAHSAIIVRADLYKRLGMFDESMGIMADMDMLIRFALECDVGYVKETLHHYSGRGPDDPLFEFRWSDRVEYFLVRAKNYERVYADSPNKLNQALSVLQHQIDFRLVETMLYLAIHRKPEQIEAGWPVVARFASRPAYALARVLASDHAAVSTLRAVAYRAWRSMRRR